MDAGLLMARAVGGTAVFASASAAPTSGSLDWNLIVAIAGVGVAVLFGTIAALQGSREGKRNRRPTMSTPDQLDAAARRLDKLVQQQWREEVRIRQLHDPAAVSVRWKPAGAELGDHRRLAGTLSGRTDDMPHLVEAFWRLPQRRLIVLGEPGTGKTTLAVLFTLQLCNRLNDRDPVPVLVALGSWSPEMEPLRTWIKRRLAEDYAVLRAPEFGPTAIEDLVATGRVLPVLDGLDELPKSSALAALRRIREALATDDPLVITCRTADYRDMVTASDVVTGAAVIEAQTLNLNDIVKHLKDVVAPDGRTRQWQPVFDHLRAHPDGPLASALATPLMLSLLRAIYVDVPMSPSRLLDASDFPDRQTIESHLLDALVPTLVVRATGNEAMRHLVAWDAVSCQRWTAYLAVHLGRLGKRDFAWWELAPVGRSMIPLGAGAFGVASALITFGLNVVLGIDRTLAFVAAATVGLVVILGVLVGGTGTEAVGSREQPSQVIFRVDRNFLKNMWPSLRFGLTLGLGVGVVFALGLGLASHQLDKAPLWFLGGFAVPTALSLGPGLASGLVRPSKAPPSPLVALRADRTAWILRWLAVGSMFGLVYGLGLGLLISASIGISMGVAAALALGFAAASGQPWLWYQATRCWLAFRGRIPWRTMAFLRHCHRLGILRQVGPVYQFRHARLQDHLTARTSNRNATANFDVL